MEKYILQNDYSEGIHPSLLQALNSANSIQTDSYNEDRYSIAAAEAIRKNLNKDADIHFCSGGTQANIIAISSMLKSFESVIAPKSGHIAVHEAGAIEATGHKINTVETNDGKLRPENVKTVLDIHTDEHMVKPRLVFISNTTEIGTIYTKKELTELSDFCKKNELLLYLDGARLASALTSHANDLSLSDLAILVDMFYIGGTKNGALLGEAIVINNNNLKRNFRYHLKQKGALLAKGRVLGIQFLELFKDDLFYNLGRHANEMAYKLSEGIEASDYSFLTEPVSNQIFPILPNNIIEKLRSEFQFYTWKKVDNNLSAVRLVTSWATKIKTISKFISLLNETD
ncbi:MAG TPA: aminotransferase class V-fold PLP-dependent enzyme [Victivallales bacterium]|nr:aminotransferase class V-fold PLP-dependent enzyme [Victivallales bacterium]